MIGTVGESSAATPLGGVSAANGVLPANMPINYLLLAIVLVLAVVVAFLFGAQRTETTQVLQVVPTSAPLSAEESVVTIEAPVVSRVETVQLQSPVKHQPKPQPSTETKTQPKPEAEVPLQMVPQTLLQHAKVRPATTSQSPQSRSEQRPVTASRAGSDVDTQADTEAMEEDVLLLTDAPIEKTLRPLSAAQRADQLFQRGVLELGRGERGQAGGTLESALNIDPTHLRSRETLAALLLNDGRVAEAGAVLHDGLRLQPKAQVLAKLYARILAEQGDSADAIAVLEQALTADTHDVEYLALLAALYQREQRHTQAAQTDQRVLQQRPAMASGWMGRALSLESLGDTAQALSAYQRAQQLGGLSSEVRTFVTERIRLLLQTVPAASTQNNNAGED